jgi:hypothetical protein
MAGSKRWTAMLVAVAATLVIAVGAPADGALARRPAIRFAHGVPADFKALAEADWVRFTDAFPARWACIPSVTVTGAWTFAQRARYDPRLRLVTVRIPGTAPNLEASLIHEFAHHLAFGCAAQRALRARFLAAQGLSTTSAWFGGSSWDRIPSEQFAEATVVAVLGRASRPQVPVRPEAARLIRAWGRGG